MGAVNESTDITALVEEIQKQSHRMRQGVPGARSEDIFSLLLPLQELQNASTAGNPALISQLERHISQVSHGIPADLKKDFTALRKRILLTAYARALKAPELSAAPYADKEPEAAVKALCDDLALRGQWQRLLEILQVSPPAPERSGTKEDDAVTAIRSYLAGKNFELAELWVDAVLAYKTVLRSSATRILTQAAADRIKAIANAHPGAIAEAASREKPAAANRTNTPASPTAKP